MKKNKIIIICVSLLVIIALAVFLIFHFKKEKDDYIYMDAHEISELTKSEYEMPEFQIYVRGVYEGSVSNYGCADIPMYDFIAGVTDGFTVTTSQYTGIKVKDIIESYDFNTFDTLTVKAPGQVMVRYDKEEINDKTFLIFYRDGKPLRDGEKATFFAADYEWRYSVENAVEFEFQ